MPLIVSKSARKPHYTDAPVPDVALRREHAIVSTHEPRLARAFTRVTRGLIGRDTQRELLQALRELYAGERTVEQVVEVVPWYNPADPLAVKLWTMLGATLRNVYADIVEDAGESEVRRLGIPMLFKVEKAFIAEDLRVPINPFSIKYVEEQSVLRVVEISAQQRELLRQIIFEGFEGGLRPEGILQQIMDTVGLTLREKRAVDNRMALLMEQEVTVKDAAKAVREYAQKLLRQRARRIARTEAIDAYSQGLQDSWLLGQQEGLIEPDVMKEWVEITASQRTCEICRGLGRQRVPLGQPFVSDIIGEIMRPTAHPNCRCTMLLVPVDDPAEYALADNDVLAARATLAED